MYIMCVCLFSALSRTVGALQISIIIIIKSLVLVGCGVGGQITVLGGGEWSGGSRESDHSFVRERRFR